MKKVVLIVLLLSGFATQAQVKPTWNVSVGGSFPLGNFTSFSYDPNTLVTNCGIMDEDANGGAASTGINLGIGALYPTKTENLSFAISADFNYNGINGEAKKYVNLIASYLDATLRSQVESSGGTSVSSSCAVKGRPSYFNIPIVAGLKYNVPMNNGMVFFAEGGVGLNMRFITPITLYERMNYLDGGYYYEMNIDERYKYPMKGSLAFRLGAGIRFAEKLSLGAYYYYMGSGDVSATVIAKDPKDSSIQPSEQSMQLGTINPMMAVVRLSYCL